MNPALPRLLVIAGSDSGGGAGIQADIKTATAFGVFATTAITAVTVQDTVCVHSIHPVPASIVRDQIACVLDDIGADAIKIGMLGSAEIVTAVADSLRERVRGIPLVLDPVLAATSGSPLLQPSAISILQERLFPLATLLTPNIPEAQALTGLPIGNADQMRGAGEKLRTLGPKAVLVKGGHGGGAAIRDVLLWEGGVEVFECRRIDTRHMHGTGCTLSTAIACGLSAGLPLLLAVGHARKFLQNALETAPGFGRGHGPINHLHGIVRN